MQKDLCDRPATEAAAGPVRLRLLQEIGQWVTRVIVKG